VTSFCLVFSSSLHAILLLKGKSKNKIFQWTHKKNEQVFDLELLKTIIEKQNILRVF